MNVIDDLSAAFLVEGIELAEPIGQGGTARVWGARWRDQHVAVKVLEAGTGFSRRLAHPGILKVLGEGTALGRPYRILEHFPTDLGRLLDKGPLMANLRRPILLQLLDAVDYAHQRKIVHGDLKPANVLVDPRAPVRIALSDFGQGGAAGPGLEASMMSAERDAHPRYSTLAYLAPERLAGGEPTLSSDLFALGVLLFEVFTGRLPHGLELPSELQPDVDRRLDGLIKTLLAREPEQRFGSVAVLRRELLRLLPGGRGLATPVEWVGGDQVHIRAGRALLGDPDQPRREVLTTSFWIDRTPVTNHAYLAFVCATGADRPPAWPASGRLPAPLWNLPVTGVTWEQANAYAEWAGKRLPSEEEWERVAQGPEGWAYPYGETLDPARIHTDPRHLTPVGTLPRGASSEGVFDLTGNGWEWTSSTCEEAERERVIRGGYDPREPRSASSWFGRTLRGDALDPGVTFRCARDAE